MKSLLLALCALLTLPVLAQQPYWQQQTDYTINVSLNDQAHTLRGDLKLAYTNNSPDALSFIWFHLWPNAYKNEGTAFARQLLRDAEGRKRLQELTDKGFIDSLQFSVDGQPARTEAHPEHIDVVKLLLPKPLPAGGTITITTPFLVDLPAYTSRSGHAGQSYMVTQWYPKPAVYDRKGWHPMPYLDQGEFYSEFGSFNVNINLPSAYIVGATGQLQNEKELAQYKAMGTKNVAAASRQNVQPYKAEGARKTLTYAGSNIHDFAWFADKDFVVRYDTLQLSGGRVVDVFAYHHPDGNRHWVKGTDYVKSGTRAFSAYLGDYAYPVVSAVEGPKNEMSGGMEYPMVTLITSPEADGEYLDAVITHEVGHNWLYGMLASNERAHAWMDEGLNSYLQFRYEAEKYRASSIFGAMLPVELRKKPVDEFQDLVYSALRSIPMDEPIATHSADFKSKESYGLVSYLKTAVWMYGLESAVGQAQLDAALQAYFNQWKFKHPYPEDLEAALEKSLGRDLDNYFKALHKKGGL